MRGGDSLVIALALPLRTATGEPFPARELIIFLTFAVIFDTLVLQGLTLKPLLRWLRLQAGGELDDEEAHARRVAAEVGLRRLDEEGRRDGVDPEVVGLAPEEVRRRGWTAGPRATGTHTAPRTRTTGLWRTGTAAAPSATRRATAASGPR